MQTVLENACSIPEETLGQIAAKDLRKAAVLKKYNLDFCCGGKKTLSQACQDKGLDLEKIRQELQQIDQSYSTPTLSYDDWNLDFLADYIVNTHHRYVKKTLPQLREYAAKVAKVHGRHFTHLPAIYELVEKIADELTMHMVKEEKTLFPYIREMIAAEQSAQCLCPAFGTVRNPIRMMEIEHEAAGRDMEEIRRLSNNFTIPEDACGSHSLLLRMLAEFESDLHVHVHLENNILFPKAQELEKKLMS